MATATMTPLEKGLAIAKLYDAWRAVDTSTINEWVSRGLMTPEEYQDYRAGSDVESQVYEAGRRAEGQVPKPVLNHSQKYQEALDRLAALTREKYAQEAAAGALKACHSPYHSSQEFAGLFQNLHEQAKALEKGLPPFDFAALASAERSVEAFRRTKQGDQDRAAWDAYHSDRQRANDMARKAVLNAYPAVMRGKRLAEQAKARRVAERQQPIADQIRAILSV